MSAPSPSEPAATSARVSSSLPSGPAFSPSSTPTLRAQAPSSSDERLFAPEGSAEGCASGDCLPEEVAPDDRPPGPLPTLPPSAIAWRKAVEAVRVASVRYGKSLSFGRLVSAEPGLLKVAFPPEAGFHRATVFGNARGEIEKQISAALGQATRLQEDSSNAALAAAPKSIAEQDFSDRTAREQSIEARMRSHPAVQNVLRLFGGQVEHVQVLDPLPAVGEETPPPPEDDT